MINPSKDRKKSKRKIWLKSPNCWQTFFINFFFFSFYHSYICVKILEEKEIIFEYHLLVSFEWLTIFCTYLYIHFSLHHLESWKKHSTRPIFFIIANKGNIAHFLEIRGSPYSKWIYKLDGRLSYVSNSFASMKLIVKHPCIHNYLF